MVTLLKDYSKQNFCHCFLPGSNRRPCACEAHVITTTLRKHNIPKSKNLDSSSITKDKSILSVAYELVHIKSKYN